MKALLFLAVFALATQVYTSEVTEFYRTFINNIPMDVQTKNQIMNDGLDCINMATNSLLMAVGKVQQDINKKDLINLLRDVIGSVEIVEKSVVPKCVQTYMQLHYWVKYNAGGLDATDPIKFQLFQARLVQLAAKTILDAMNFDNGVVAKDLAVLFNTRHALIDANLPALLELDFSQFVPMTEETALPLFFKGLFNGLGVYDSAKINGTSQCVLGVVGAVKTIVTNPALQRGDFYTKAHIFLDSLMPLTDSFERCQQLNTVDKALFARMISMFKQYPLLTLFRVTANSAMELPEVMANEYNLSILMMQGKYEQAGQLYAKNFRTIYNGVF